MQRKKALFARVDHQVSLLVAAAVLVSSLSVFSLCYAITYSDMINSLQDRVMAIYHYLEISLQEATFRDINLREDMAGEVYQTAKKTMEKIRRATGVMYLYTAKATPTGELVYVIDGLDYSAPDFRYPGDMIEQEIQADLRLALTGVTILPHAIKTTQWGKIFISYLPIYYNGEIAGVVGIEFEAEHQYNTYRQLKLLTPVISVLFCLLAVLLSFLWFRRISNPHYRDLSNTDHATQMKNRNAFDLDIQNRQATKRAEGVGLVVLDLNHLKKVNDTLGHSTGDRYIQLAAQVLTDCAAKQAVFYRIGGDEFAGILPDASEQQITRLLEQVHARMEERRGVIGMDVSLSAGFAIFDPAQDENLLSTYRRADEKMYAHKRLLQKERYQMYF